MKLTTLCTLALAAAGLFGSARAQINTTTGSSTNWSANAAWTLNHPPTVDESAVIAHNLTVVAAPGTIGALTVQAGKILTFATWNDALAVTGAVSIAGTVTHATQSDAAAPWVPTARVFIECNEMEITASGKIDVTGKGYQPDDASPTRGPGGGLRVDVWGGGGSYGGLGGANTAASVYGDAAAPTDPGSAGARSAWAAGNAGGGAVRLIVTNRLTLSGSILANGNTGGSSRTGGGSGGAVYVTCGFLAGSGVLQARGGDGASESSTQWVGGGGGGRVALVYDPVRQAAQNALAAPSLQICARGGRDSKSFNYPGEPGTLHLSDASFFPGTTLRGGLVTIPGFTSWTVAGNLSLIDGQSRFPTGFVLRVNGNLAATGRGTLIADDLDLIVSGNFTSVAGTTDYPRHELRAGPESRCEIGGLLYVTNSQVILRAAYAGGIPEITVGGSATLAGSAPLVITAGATNGVAPAYGARLAVAGDLAFGTNALITVAANPTTGATTLFECRDFMLPIGARIDGKGLGFPQGNSTLTYNNGNGPGRGEGKMNAGGGGHGGRGGLNGAAYGLVYANAEKPETAGSSGGRSAWAGSAAGAGGAGLRLIALRTLTIDGTVDMDGTACTHNNYGGGAGGGLFLSSKTLRGTGALRARGGNGGTGSGGGGGGAIAVWSHWFDQWAGSPTKVAEEGLESNAAALAAAVAGGSGSTIGSTGTLYWKTTPLAEPNVRSAPPTIPFADNAVELNGTLVATGLYATAVSALWRQDADGGEVLANWTAQALPGVTEPGDFSYTAALAKDAVWFVRFYAVNVAGESWSDPVSFATADIFVERVAHAAETNETAGSFRIWRDEGSAAMAVTVPFTVGGSAVEGVDYRTLPAHSVVLGVGETQAIVTISTLFDAEAEGDETVSLTLLDGSFIGSGRAAELTISNAPIITGANETIGAGLWRSGVLWSLGREPVAGDAVTLKHNMTLDRATLGAQSLVLESGKVLTFRGWNSQLNVSGLLTLSGTVTHDTQTDTAAPWVADSRVLIACGSLDLPASGRINVTAKGYLCAGTGAVGYGPGGGGVISVSGAGGSHGAAGGLNPVSGYGLLGAPEQPGSAGGGAAWNRGGYGGGAVRLIVGSHATLEGEITANGEDALHQCAGGGAGGSVYITCATLSGAGLITANGGYTASVDGTSDTRYGGGGSGGRIALTYNTAAQAVQNATALPALRIAAAEGHVGNCYSYLGDPGTVTLSDASFFPTVPLRGGRIIIPGFTAWTVGGDLTLQGGLTAFTNGFALTVGGDLVTSGRGGLLADDFAVQVAGNFRSEYATPANRSRSEIRSGPSSALSIGGDLRFANAQLAVEQDAGSPVAITVGGSALFTGDRALTAAAAATNAAGPAYGFHLAAAGTLTVTNTLAVLNTRRGSMLCLEANDLVIAAGAQMDGNARGFQCPAVPYAIGGGPGGGLGAIGSGGGGYGGNGGRVGATTGRAYGVAETPAHAGSAGGHSHWDGSLGGHGGAGVRLIASRNLTLDGSLAVNGGNANHEHAGGGAGGGVFITCKRFLGGGSISARGGSVAGAASTGGSGAGGRIAIHASRTEQWLGLPEKTAEGLDSGETAVAAVATGTQVNGYVGQTGTVYWLTPPAAGSVILLR